MKLLNEAIVRTPSIEKGTYSCYLDEAGDGILQVNVTKVAKDRISLQIGLTKSFFGVDKKCAAVLRDFFAQVHDILE